MRSVQSDTLSGQFCKQFGKSFINKLKRGGFKTSPYLTPICELKHWPSLLSTFSLNLFNVYICLIRLQQFPPMSDLSILISIPGCITVSKAHLKSTKHA